MLFANGGFEGRVGLWVSRGRTRKKLGWWVVNLFFKGCQYLFLKEVSELSTIFPLNSSHQIPIFKSPLLISRHIKDSIFNHKDDRQRLHNLPQLVPPSSNPANNPSAAANSTYTNHTACVSTCSASCANPPTTSGLTRSTRACTSKSAHIITQ
jgi:hypothetical protein